MTFDENIIESFAKKYIDDLRQRVDDSKVTASGNFKKSLTYYISEYELIIYGAKYAGAIEFGRKPTAGGGNGQLLKAIRSWINDKNISPREAGMSKESLAYAITKKIHKDGTRLFGPESDYYGRTKPSKVIDGIKEDGRIAKLSQDLALKMLNEITSQIIQPE